MTNKLLTGPRVVNEIMKCGITHVIWLPDAYAKFMYDAMRSQPGLTLVPMCREGEAIAIAAGLITGGKKAMLLHQSTGLFESGDSVRLALDYKLPLLLMLGYVGWQHDVPMTTSAAIYTEPILDAWHIKHYLLETDDDVEKISRAYEEANETKRPVVVLITQKDQSELNPQTSMFKAKKTRMDCFEAEKVISRHRHNAIVITAETANHEWPQISSDPDLDAVSLPHIMGKASSFGLGLALALPRHKIIVLDADGSLLMNLGSLVTIANMAPTNLIHFVMENDVYRTTGGQPIPGAGKISFRGLAKDAGYHHVYEFDKLEDLESSIETIMSETGPIFVCLKVQPLTERATFPSPSSAEAESLSNRLRKAASRSAG